MTRAICLGVWTQQKKGQILSGAAIKPKALQALRIQANEGGNAANSAISV